MHTEGADLIGHHKEDAMSLQRKIQALVDQAGSQQTGRKVGAKTVPIPAAAVALLEAMPKMLGSKRVIPGSESQMEHAWREILAQRTVLSLTAALEAMYDREAQSHRYDNRFTCALRAGYPGPFQAEGLKFAEWMDSCNAKGYQVMAECQAGKRAIPTEEEFLGLMPVMVWP